MADSVDPRVDSVIDTAGAAAAFRRQVRRPVARLRPPFAVALVATLAFAFGVIVWDQWLRPGESARVVVPASPVAMRGCTALEVEEVLRTAALSDVDRVTCLAVAGKIDRARELLRAMSGAARPRAIAEVFAVAHPIADRGDDASAGPIMALIVEFWPDNYMAVFHAGMAAFALGRDDEARRQLERFLTLYPPHDVWRARAEQALAAIASHTALDQRQAHFAE
jgi:tetratricopeptide (TPR) repeat protein